jgi:hypothetical protein
VVARARRARRCRAARALGYIGHFSELKTYDVPGLSSRAVVQLERHGGAWGTIAAELHPEWLVLRPGEIGEGIALQSCPFMAATISSTTVSSSSFTADWLVCCKPAQRDGGEERGAMRPHSPHSPSHLRQSNLSEFLGPEVARGRPGFRGRVPKLCCAQRPGGSPRTVYGVCKNCSSWHRHPLREIEN